MLICRGRYDMTLRVFPIGKRKFPIGKRKSFAGIRLFKKSARDRTYGRRRRAAALHVDDENFSTLRLLRK
jgi:hypothetical protein